MLQLGGLKGVALCVLLMMAAGCKDDDDDPAAAQNNPPTISGTPTTDIRAGESYDFKPSAADADGQALRFTVSNLPGWLNFDSVTGGLSGTPRDGDIGSFPGVTISVSDGTTTRALGPFTIKVNSAGSTLANPPVTAPPPLPSAGGPFRFAEIPEIAFVRGYRETEHLGIFQLDTLNRWTPGDLDNGNGWKPRVATELRLESGTLDGVSYDPVTGVLHYDGSGQGTQTARVTLSAPTEATRSQEFVVRVLAPTIVWGAGAAQRFPGIGYDAAGTPWQEMRQRMRHEAPNAQPNVLMITAGRYSGDFYLAQDLLNLYIVGEPGSRPVLAGDTLNLDGLETAYLKNLELDDTTVHTSRTLPDRAVNTYVTRVYQHDSTRDENGFKASPGSPDASGSWRYWFWNFHGSQMGWKSNLRHQMYVEGRLNSSLLINNIRITGSKECSSVKSTRSFVTIRNSYLSAMLDEHDPAVGMRSDKIVDLIGASEIVMYNNELVGAFSQSRWGVVNGLVFMQARRAMWGADSPVYPDLSWSPPQTSLRAGFAPEGFTSGPETFVNSAFWDVVASYDIADPANPYSFKKYFAYNRFRWIDEENRRRPAFRDDGTAPRTAAYLGSAAEIWGTAPPNWVERSVSFFANNRYEGWLADDLSDPKRWFDLDGHVAPSLVSKSGPGPWPYPPPPRSVVFLGGEQRPDAAQAPIEIPGWFRL